MNTSNKKIAIYSRKSKYTGKGDSVANQIEMCKQYILSNFGEEALNNTDIYEDEGFSGKNLNRPGFKKMLRDAEQGEIRYIVVYRLDRISRNVGDFSKLIEFLTSINVSFISISEKFDTSNPMGRAMMYIASVFSQLERETIAERITDNLLELSKTGRWLGGTPPTGFIAEKTSTVSIDGKSRKASKLKKCQEEAEKIRFIGDLYLKFESIQKTETELMNRNILSKNGKYYSRFTIKTILNNPVYAIADQDTCNFFKEKGCEVFFDVSECDGVKGIMPYNRTSQQDKNKKRTKDYSQWIIALGEHEGIFTGKEWVKIQETLDKNKTYNYKQGRVTETLVSGRIFCKCGSRMYCKPLLSSDKNGRRNYVYMCRLKERSKGELCDSKSINGLELDDAIIEYLKSKEPDINVTLKHLKKTKKIYTNSYLSTKEMIDGIENTIQNNELKINKLIDSLEDTSYDSVKKQILQRIELYTSENDNLKIKLKEMQSENNSLSLNAVGLDMMIESLSSFKNNIENATYEEKLSLVRSVVKKVEFDGENIHIFLFADNNNDINLPTVENIQNNGNIVPKTNLGEYSKKE